MEQKALGLKKTTFFLFIALSPLLMIGMWNRHDWGDDFAQYLLQTRNIVDGRAQADNGLVFAGTGEHYAVSAYPVGFPLMLAPIYLAAGLQVRPYFFFLSALLLLSGLLMYLYYWKQLPPYLAVLLPLVVCYNQYVMEWKWQILSDIPFLFLAFLAFVKWKPDPARWVETIAWGCYGGMVMSVRIVGICLPLAMALTMMVRSSSGTRSRLFHVFLLLASSIAGFLVLNVLLFDVPIIEFTGFYSSAVQEHGSALWNNLSFYSDLAGVFLPLPFTDIAIPAWWMIPALAIWLVRLLRSLGLPEVFLIVYGTVLLYYPYQDGGFRFLLPLLPLLIGYLFEALVRLASLVNTVKYIQAIPIIIAIAMLAGGSDFIVRAAKRKSTEIQGPQSESAEELWGAISSLTPYESIIAFNKPRAMALYSERRSTCIVRHATPATTHRQFEAMGVDYIVLSTAKQGEETFASDFAEYVRSQAFELDTAWTNGKFILLKNRSSTPLP